MFQYIFGLKKYNFSSVLLNQFVALLGLFLNIFFSPSKDMVAFSCCEYDGGDEEKHEMDVARERSWRGKFRRRGRVIRPGANRMDGKCPLTPLEVHKFVSLFIGKV